MKEDYTKYLQRSALALISEGIASSNNFEVGGLYEITFKVKCGDVHLSLAETPTVKLVDQKRD